MLRRLLEGLLLRELGTEMDGRRRVWNLEDRKEKEMVKQNVILNTVVNCACLPSHSELHILQLSGISL